MSRPIIRRACIATISSSRPSIRVCPRRSDEARTRPPGREAPRPRPRRPGASPACGSRRCAGSPASSAALPLVVAGVSRRFAARHPLHRRVLQALVGPPSPGRSPGRPRPFSSSSGTLSPVLFAMAHAVLSGRHQPAALYTEGRTPSLSAVGVLGPGYPSRLRGAERCARSSPRGSATAVPARTSRRAVAGVPGDRPCPTAVPSARDRPGCRSPCSRRPSACHRHPPFGRFRPVLPLRLRECRNTTIGGSRPPRPRRSRRITRRQSLRTLPAPGTSTEPVVSSVASDGVDAPRIARRVSAPARP